MKVSLLKKRFSFQVKVLVPVLVVMVLLVASTLWLTRWLVNDQSEQQSARQLETAANLVKNLQEDQAEQLLMRSRNINNQPKYIAYAAIFKEASIHDKVESYSDRHSSAPALTPMEAEKKVLEEIATNGIIYLNTVMQEQNAVIAGWAYVRRDEPVFITTPGDSNIDAQAFQTNSELAIRKAFATKAPVVDTIGVGSRLLNVMAVPLFEQEQLLAILYLGVDNDRDALKIKQVTHSEIVYTVEGRVAASSLPADALAQLTALYNKSSPVSKSAVQSEKIAGEHFRYRRGTIQSLNDQAKIGYLVLSSTEDSLTALKATQQKLAMVGIIGILAGAMVVFVVIRKVTEPLRQLRDSAEAVGRGDFSRRVKVASHDECGQLAGAFNQMTENIQTSRAELEKTVETLKTTQHQLIQSEKLSGIGEFVAGVAHELNNPLTSVMGFAELLQQSDLSEQHRRFTEVIFKSAKRCQKIVSSLLSFARRHAPERKVVSLNEIVESAAEILQYQMRTGGIEVSLALDPHLPPAEVDPHQMQQVFLNIINNARQAMEGRPTVHSRLRISTEFSQGRIRVIFQDNGPGIAPENIKKIFNPFFTTKEVGKGTGLGLSLCYGIVSEHGGNITPRSTVGEGATFVIDLPVAPNTAIITAMDPAPTPAALPNEGAGKRVLVIDDEDSILQMVREALSTQGYQVDIAHDGETALRRLGQQHYDLTLCDWRMPGINGRQIYEQLHAANPEMSRRLIFITGDVVNDKVQEYLQARNKICLTKPFTLVEFRSAISQVLAAG